MTVTDRNLNVGDRFEAVYRGEFYVLEAIDAGDGKIAFQLLAPEKVRIRRATGLIRTNVFGSLSSAAGAVTGGKAKNGWLFWSPAPIEVEVARARKRPAEAQSPPARRRSKRQRKQRVA